MSRIAVLIPVFNQPQGLQRTLESVDREDADLEFFVVDDGSEPPVDIDTRHYRHPVHLITLERNRGCTAARNIALQRILERDFDYVALQDAGDTDVGERMAEQAAFLDRHPEIAVVGAWALYVDPAGQPLYVYKAPATTQQVRQRMPYVSAFAHPASMIRLSALNTVGLYDPAYRIASDYEMFFRLTRCFETANIQKILIHKEDRPDSLSLGQRKRSLLYRLRAQFQYFRALSVHSYLGVLWTVLMLMFPYRLIVAVKRWRGYAH